MAQLGKRTQTEACKVHGKESGDQTEKSLDLGTKIQGEPLAAKYGTHNNNNEKIHSSPG